MPERPTEQHRPDVTEKLTRIGIVGGGLIGGSLAESCRRHFPDIPLALADHCGKTRTDAMSSGLFSAGVYTDSGDMLRTSGEMLLIIAVPLLSYNAILESLAPALQTTDATVYITDVGSVKYYIRERFRAYMPHMLGYVVGAHPIAGAEHTGFSARDPMLFEHSRTILCPGYSVHNRTMSMVREFWQKISGETVNVPCEEHDAMYAYVSHLPQLIAFGLAQLYREHPDEPPIAPQRAFTRLYDSSLSLWHETFFCNAPALNAALDIYGRALHHAIEAVGKQPLVYKADIQEAMLSTPVARRLRMPAARTADSTDGVCGAFEYSVTASLVHTAMLHKDFGGPAFADTVIAAYAGTTNGVTPGDIAALHAKADRLLHYCRTLMNAAENRSERFSS